MHTGEPRLQEKFSVLNKKNRTVLKKHTHSYTYVGKHSLAFGRIEPAVWLIFNCFSSEYFFLRILKLEKGFFRGSLRERPALLYTEPPPPPHWPKIPFLKPFLVN